jgi:hypothetical protein
MSGLSQATHHQALVCLHQNLLPDRNLIVKRELTPYQGASIDKSTKLDMRHAYDVNLGASWSAKTAPSLMFAMQAPTDGCTRWHHRVFPANLMVDGELRRWES